MFEGLEERAVFSVAPLDLSPEPRSLSLNFTKVEGVVGTDHAWESAASMQGGTGRGLIGDLIGDGRDDPAGFAAQGMDFYLLPYIEQDNLFKSTACNNTVNDDEAPHSQLTSNLRGEAIDIIPLVQQPTPICDAHDAAFAELASTTGDSRWADPHQQQIIAVLIGLLADRSTGAVPDSSSRIADVTDGTSNTLMLYSLPSAGALNLNDHFI